MIVKLVSALIGWGVPEKFAKPVLFLVGAVALVAVLGVGKCSYEKSVIANHENEQRAANAEQHAGALANQGEQARADDDQIRTEQDELEGVPTDADRPLTDNERAFLRCVRLQQQARARAEPVPPC